MSHFAIFGDQAFEAFRTLDETFNEFHHDVSRGAHGIHVADDLAHGHKLQLGHPRPADALLRLGGEHVLQGHGQRPR